MNVLALITARGGSKGIPRKNLSPLAGKPLIAWTIECAMAVHDRLGRIIVSTDDEEIAGVSRKYGAEVPFLRPASLSRDDATSLDVVRHAVETMEKDAEVPFDWVLLLQPTSPLRRPEDLHQALDIAAEGDCDAVIAVTEVVESHPMLLKTIENGRLAPYGDAPLDGVRRQDCRPPVYINNGAIYLSRRELVMERNTLLGDNARPYIMPLERSLDIDTAFDLKLAEAFI